MFGGVGHGPASQGPCDTTCIGLILTCGLSLPWAFGEASLHVNPFLNHKSWGSSVQGSGLVLETVTSPPRATSSDALTPAAPGGPRAAAPHRATPSPRSAGPLVLCLRSHELVAELLGRSG